MLQVLLGHAKLETTALGPRHQESAGPAGRQPDEENAARLTTAAWRGARVKSPGVADVFRAHGAAWRRHRVRRPARRKPRPANLRANIDHVEGRGRQAAYQSECAGDLADRGRSFHEIRSAPLRPAREASDAAEISDVPEMEVVARNIPRWPSAAGRRGGAASSSLRSANHVTQNQGALGSSSGASHELRLPIKFGGGLRSPNAVDCRIVTV